MLWSFSLFSYSFIVLGPTLRSLIHFELIFVYDMRQWMIQLPSFACGYPVFAYLFFSFLGPHTWHMKVPRLGVESGLQLLAYATATAMPDPSRVCDLHCSLQQRWILNPLRGARGRTHILMDTSQVPFCWTTVGTPQHHFMKRNAIGWSWHLCPKSFECVFKCLFLVFLLYFIALYVYLCASIVHMFWS